MRSVLTAAIAAIEAMAVALTVLALIGVPSVLLWWLAFDLGADPRDLASLIASLWQLVHFLPLQVSLTAQEALGLGFPPEALGFAVSLAPLGLTLLTVVLSARSGWRFAGRGGAGAWALLGGLIGFGAAAAGTAQIVGAFGVWPMWARITVPVAIFAVPQALAFVIRSAVDGLDWWAAAVRWMQRRLAPIGPIPAAAFPERAAETIRLAGAGLALLVGLGAAGTTISIIFGYVDIVTLSQQLHLDGWGALALFVLQLILLPIAWVWAIAWFTGPGFAIGQATSVTPFESLLGPLPGLPLLGALPEGWGWAGAIAPAIVVACGAALGGVFAARPVMRRSPAIVAVLVPIIAGFFVGAAAALLCLLATGAIGPGRLATTGPVPWQVGLAVALELAFGMSLGVFARRVDLPQVQRQVRDLLPAERNRDVDHGFGDLDLQDQTETMPVAPLAPEMRDERTVEAEAAEVRPDARRPEPDEPRTEAPTAEPGEAKDAVDPLLQEFSWNNSAEERSAPEPRVGWRDRLRRRRDRD